MGAVVIFGHLDEVLDKLHLVHLYSKWPPETFFSLGCLQRFSRGDKSLNEDM